MSAFIAYIDWGMYEGSSEPKAVFSTKEKADAWIAAHMRANQLNDHS